MNQTSISVSALLERFESELQTADGRTVKVCRDAYGNFWVVDGAERVVSVSEFASDCSGEARKLCERERAKAFREFAVWVRQGVACAARALRPGGKPAHA